MTRKRQRPDPPPRMPRCPICSKPWRCPDHQTAPAETMDEHPDLNITPDQTTVIRPGQTLILRYARRTLTPHEAEQLKTKLGERVPGSPISPPAPEERG